LFLDRDGVVNELVYYPDYGEWEAPRSVADLRLRAGAADAIRQASRNGWLVFLITNQPSYAKGKCPLQDLQAVHREVLQQLKEEGVTVTDSFVCYHHPESKIEGFGTCECRKPSPFFIREAATAHGIDLGRSWMAGDQDTDIEAGRRAGVRTALINYEHSHVKRGAVEPDLVCADLAELVRNLD
ncbi:MAG TPA: HAD-IIIA family hydrolase, partial [Thermoanaerobaculia bacterium]|nr:HAD-IIIA family hydrolase [Thermoanaerobaculia bacterium]